MLYIFLTKFGYLSTTVGTKNVYGYYVVILFVAAMIMQNTPSVACILLEWRLCNRYIITTMHCKHKNR